MRIDKNLVSTAFPGLVVWLAAGLLLAGSLTLLWADRSMPQSGLWLLLGLSVTVGFAHGALDTWLLLGRFKPFGRALWLTLAYLLVVLTVGWLLSDAPAVALLALVLVSAWHFGEDYARWQSMPQAASLLTRVVVGGAPVMAPLVLKPEAVSTVFSQVNLLAGAVSAWQFMAWIWLAMAIFWALRWGCQHASASRFAWLELLGVLLLNGVFSPLMAFALYFGLYHAPVHIWRVCRGCPSVDLPLGVQNLFSMSMPSSRSAVLALTVLLTLFISIGLWWRLDQQIALEGLGLLSSNYLPLALPWLVVSLAALTLPHLVLISCCAPWLSAAPEKAQ